MADLWRRVEILNDTYGPIGIRTEKPVALDSPDHLHPRGTKNDNSTNVSFNAKCRTLWWPGACAVLDLGCAGGGMVRTFIEEGHLAVGIEGSDYSLASRRAEWATIPDFLLTADITSPFELRCVKLGALRFRVITLWEVLEHIWQDNLRAVFDNIERHLADDGIVVASVCTGEDTWESVQMHQTIKPREWWMETFWRLGWANNPALVRWFGTDMVRYGDNAPASFHVVLSRKTG